MIVKKCFKDLKKSLNLKEEDGELRSRNEEKKVLKQKNIIY